MATLLSFFALCLFSPLLKTAGGFVETSWSPHGASDTLNDIAPRKRQVPTISYDYQPPKPRQRHHPSDSRWRDRQKSYYDAPPKIELPSLADKASVLDVLSSTERRSKIPTSGVYRTYGKGQAVIPYKGATVHVPKSFGSHKAYKAMVSTRVFEPPKRNDFDDKDVISRSRRDCASCPKDEIVVASKGNAYVLLPEPCSHRWLTVSGPKPGTKLSEGVHYITGTIGPKRKVCQYRYQVQVRHCPQFQSHRTEISCTADNAWGSKCTFSCPRNAKMVGNNKSECNDALEWSNPEPTCLENNGCLIPDMQNGTKLNCETNELTNTNSNYLPEGAYCRMNDNGVETAIKCRKGKWKQINHLRGKKRRNGNRNSAKEWRKGSVSNQCEPNPCLQGGSCLISSSGLHSSFICLCRPSTEGPRCEFSECQENPCKNNARCLHVNGTSSCFCRHNYIGEFCENYQ